MVQLPRDFKEFLQLLNENKVEYLLVGGYAVAYYGYVRATVDLDVWVAGNVDNGTKVVRAVRQFGFDVPELSEALFLNARLNGARQHLTEPLLVAPRP